MVNQSASQSGGQSVSQSIRWSISLAAQSVGTRCGGSCAFHSRQITSYTSVQQVPIGARPSSTTSPCAAGDHSVLNPAHCACTVSAAHTVSAVSVLAADTLCLQRACNVLAALCLCLLPDTHCACNVLAALCLLCLCLLPDTLCLLCLR